MPIIRQHHARFRERNESIKAAYKAGMPLETIGKVYGLTRQRIQQICKDFRLDRTNAGASVRPFWDTKRV